MKNRWIKRNPLMSVWLSGANARLDSGTPGCATAPHTKTMLTRSTQEMAERWMSAANASRTRMDRRRRMQ
jgi:hypothetical protein